MTLNINSSGFKEKVVAILALLERIHPNFYPTWQEAVEAIKHLDIGSKEEYARKYRRDLRLPSSPRYTYGADFPGWDVFLGRRRAELYATWQEASKAAMALGIHSTEEYKKRYREDPRLPADPPSFRGCPGWTVFFGKELKNFYPTWKDIARVCKQHKIKSVTEYRELCRQDARLPRHPFDAYKDFPGFAKILKLNRVENPYPTWQEASKAVQKLGIKSSTQYLRRYKEDPRLYAAPSERRADFPGWSTFLGIPERKIVQNPYPTWQEASMVSKKLGIRTEKEYRSCYKKDPRLPSSPHRYKGFPGWAKFLGRLK